MVRVVKFNVISASTIGYRKDTYCQSCAQTVVVNYVAQCPVNPFTLPVSIGKYVLATLFNRLELTSLAGGDERVSSNKKKEVRKWQYCPCQ